MKLYLSVIGVAMAIVSAFNIAFGVASWYYVIIATVWCTALQFALDGGLAIIINKLPDRWFGIENRLYNVSEREKKLYRILKVRKWKDSVWELGGLGGFSKKHFSIGLATYVSRLINTFSFTIVFPLGNANKSLFNT